MVTSKLNNFEAITIRDNLNILTIFKINTHFILEKLNKNVA